MVLDKNKAKRVGIMGLSVVLCATLTASTVLMNFEGKTIAKTPENESLQFEEITDKVDTSSIMESNFNSSVLEGTLKNYETRTVVVYLSGDNVLEAKSSDWTVAQYISSDVGMKTLRSIDREQKTFLNKLTSNGISYKLKNTFNTIANAVAIEVDTSNVKRIKELGGVESAVIAQTYLAPQTVESSSYDAPSNDANVYKTGIYDSSAYSDTEKYPWGTGAGTVVAVIDSGFDYTHDAFQRQPEGEIRMPKSSIESVVENTRAYERIMANGGSLTVDDVFLSNKVPYAFDYADNDADVYPSYSNHGTHVAGIVGGYDENGYDDKDGNHIDETFKGVAPDAQLVIMKTFTDDLEDSALGGSESVDIMAALEDCVTLGVDVINMSLGTTSGFTTTDDGDDEGEHFNAIYESIRKEGISLIVAASNDYSAGFGSIYGTNLASNPDSGTVGSPSTYYASLSVASISGQKSPYMQASDGTPIFFENARNANSVEYDYIGSLLDENQEEREFEYVVAGSGRISDYNSIKDLVKGRIVLVRRGINSFQEKVEIAARRGAIGIIIYNNVSGNIRMSLGDVAEVDRIPAVSINMTAGNALVNIAKQQGGVIGKIKVSRNLSAGPFMSEFSSWGSTPDLKIKPEITAHGGEITSTVPGGYAEQSGTSMASPNMAGLAALVRNYVRTLPIAKDFEPSQITQLTNQLILSTASTVYDDTGLAYSPRKQGSGLANLKNIVETNAYLYTDAESDGDIYYAAKDGRPKIELGADIDKSGVYKFSFKVRNISENKLTFTPQALFMTETLDSLGLAVAEKAYMLDDIAPVFSVGGSPVEKVEVGANSSVMVSVELKLSDEEKEYIDKSFKNGMFVEGFIKLISSDKEAQCDLSLPFLSFYGDWESAPMLDYTVFELADAAKDTSILPDAKPQETVWPTQAFASYGNEKFTIPIGSYCYTLDSSEEPMYAEMEHCAISRFNEIVSEDGIGNYSTSYELRCLYAGLLRNARQVNYKLYDTSSGELVTQGERYRVSKAYANGGSASPGYINLELSADEMGLVSNGKYQMDFEFLFDKNSKVTEENTFSFTFYVDYEAPVLQDARLRYYDYNENNVDKQKIYLDLDIYDNHYAQAVMLCYIDEMEMKLATPNAVPVRNAVKNGVNTVSIEVTDIWDKYKDSLALQIDDYALNHRTYRLGNLSGSSIPLGTEAELNKNVLPDTFELAEGEENITLNINQMHKVSLVYDGNANLSNFEWKSPSSSVLVKNGEIVGARATKRPIPVTVTNRKGVAKTINVTVTDTVDRIYDSSISFGVIQDYYESLVQASGTVAVRAGKDFTLDLVKEPWYLPDSSITSISWRSDDPSVAEVDENGNVHTKKKGIATITATVEANGITSYPSVTLSVRDEYDMNGVTLRHYYGEGEVIDGQPGVVIVPTHKNIMVIDDDAFKDNTKITKIILPKTVTQIGRNAFKGCTSLKEVYFISDEDADYTADGFVADADLTLINRNAFEGCTSLEYFDMRNLKVITVAKAAFKDCVNLKKIEKPTAIGTAANYAFMGCEKLEAMDISGLHVAGEYVFAGCSSLKSITTEKYTQIGRGMFSDLNYNYQRYDYTTGEWKPEERYYPACNNLTQVTIRTSIVGEGAFANCENLQSVTFEDKTNTLEVRIGERAFDDCVKLSSVDFGNGIIKIIGAYAFRNTALTTITIPNGVENIGVGAFDGTEIVTYNGANNGYTVADGAIISGNTLISYLGNATSYTIPENVTIIAPNAFAKCKLTSLTLPATITQIGEGAFRDSELAEINILCNLSEIPAYAFYNTQITSLTLPSSVTEVRDYAFANTPITSFSFNPSYGATFGSYVFAGCKQLGTISINDNISVMGDRTFSDCISLTSANLPSVSNLGEYTFWNTPVLATVTFGANASTTGNYTFAAYRPYGLSVPATRTALTSVTLGKAITQIGDGAFFNCVNITSVDLTNCDKIGIEAFSGCIKLATANKLSDVKEIGAYAFYNCNALNELNLAEATLIGDYAFAINSGRASYSSLNIPKVQKLGNMSFFGGGATTVEIPSTLLSIGYGAFAASDNLTAFTMAEGGNDVYFVHDGVLYRNIENLLTGNDTYGLVAYPSAKPAQSYAVLDNTSRIEAFAFSGMLGKLKRVDMPYTLKAVGAYAFFDSGIIEYAFESAQAPMLETFHDEYIDELLDQAAQSFRGFYYANFEDYLLFYSELVSESNRPAALSIYRPENGKGYDNYVYSTYFKNVNITDIVMDDITREFVDAADSFPSAAEISNWNTQNQDKKYVEDLSKLVISAHLMYNGIIKDEAQLNLVGNDRVEKFLAVETALRTVKPIFGIVVKVNRLYPVVGSYKSEYFVGDTFDPTGLVIIVEYDDYSTEQADMSKMTLKSPTGPLGKYDNEVSYEGYGKIVYIGITVTQKETKPGDEGKNPESGCGGCGSAASAGISLGIMAMGIVAVMLIRRKNRGQND